MAFYKRYVPPKVAAPVPLSAPASTAAVPVKAPLTSFEHTAAEPEKKRKRERTAEEVAERKAKKLRGKGIEASADSVLKEQAVEAKKPAAKVAGEDGVGNEIVPNVGVKRQLGGDFAHVASGKQRHKLQKEARKARKEAERAAKASGQDGLDNAVGTPLQDGVSADDVQDAETARIEAAEVYDDTVHAKKPKKKWREKEASAKGADGEREDAAVASKSKKRRKDAEDQEADAATPEIDNPEAAAAEQEVATDQQALPKKRQHKLEAALGQTPDEVAKQGDDEDEDRVKKHSGVLGKFQKATKRSQPATQPADDRTETTEIEPVQLQDPLAPLPQPEKAPTPDFRPNFSALPPWLATPTIVSNDTSSSFKDLGLEQTTVGHMAGLGFKDALPVQSALMPLLLSPGTAGARYLPGSEPLLPDLAVSAATGSGKTIAYLLPIIEALKQDHGFGKLKALVVVPTRELVLQVAAIAESLAKGSNVKVGVASGTGKLKDEQDKVIHHSERYDSEGYEMLMARQHRRNYPPAEDDNDFEDYLAELEAEDVREDQRLHDAIEGMVDHVPTYYSTCDLLVCTPGRLLEHLNSTLGFSLSWLQWVVLDEADKLLDQQYDGFLETINSYLTRERVYDEQDARERLLRNSGLWDEQRERRVRKVVLSATMTMDVQKLSGLNLFRPQMIVVSGKDDKQVVAGAERAQGVRETGNGFELPLTLVEYCVPVGDGSEKPLHLVKLLENKLLGSLEVLEKPKKSKDAEVASLDDESDGDSDSSSELSTSSSEPSDSERSTSESAEAVNEAPDELTMHPARAALLSNQPSVRQLEGPANILIFTSSNESANRLSHLLCALKPDWSSLITTLTKAQPNRKHASSADGKPRITISTDRASRGLDQLSNRAITHVVQYDVPRSLESYVHRVGRTARAGRSGEAWTLYSHTEASWFLREITRTPKAQRLTAVEKVKLEHIGEKGLKMEYERVLESMKVEVFGGKSR